MSPHGAQVSTTVVLSLLDKKQHVMSSLQDMVQRGWLLPVYCRHCGVDVWTNPASLLCDWHLRQGGVEIAFSCDCGTVVAHRL